MSRLFEHVGERVQFLHAAFWLVGAATLMAGGVAFFLVEQHQVGAPGAIGVLSLGPVTGAILTLLVWRGTGAASRGIVDTVTAARGIRRKYQYSRQESLVARGRLTEAVESWENHLAEFPDDLDARLALADLHRTALKDPAGAEKGYHVVREMHPSHEQEFRLSNSLIDLYHGTGQKEKELAELARFAGTFGKTDAGRRAEAALRRIRREEG